MSLKSSNKTDVNMWELEIEISAEDFNKAVENIYQREKKNITIKGFRKGKASRKMIEKVYGENVFYEDAINSLIGGEMDAAVQELGLELVDRPSIELKSVDKENGALLTAACVVKPEIELTEADYKGIHAPKAPKEITDADVDARIDMLRQRNARIVSVDDRSAQLGDEVNINFKGFVDDEPFEGGEAEEYPLKLGSGQFIPGFEDQIVGKNIDEEFDVNVSFPDDYGVDTLAGKPAVFKCKLNSITVEELPEVDDDFVKDATEYETVDELKEKAKADLEKEADSVAEREFVNAISDALVSKIDTPIPLVMYERRTDALMRDFANQLKQYNMTVEMYAQYTGMDESAIRDTYLERAKAEVKLSLALEAIAKAEKLEVTDNELDDKLAELAKANNMELSEVKKLDYVVEDYKANMLMDKAMELVKESAVIDNDMVKDENKEEAENTDENANE